MYVLFHITMFNSLWRIKKENTNSFEMLINSFFFLIFPSSLLKNCKLQDHLKPLGLKVLLSQFWNLLKRFYPLLKLFKERSSKYLTSNLKFFLFSLVHIVTKTKMSFNSKTSVLYYYIGSVFL